jgi:hypothetical protein
MFRPLVNLILLAERLECFCCGIPDRDVVLGFAVALDDLRGEADLAGSADKELQPVVEPNAKGVQEPASLQIVDSGLERGATRGWLFAR